VIEFIPMMKFTGALVLVGVLSLAGGGVVSGDRPATKAGIGYDGYC
jgi:hypothetical protein